MRTIAIDDPGVCQSVCYVGELCKTTERIDILFGVETPRDPRNIVLDGGPNPHSESEGVRCGLCQITVATCYPHC